MRENDALENNPHVSRSALEALHSQLYGWALSRCDFDHATAEDLMQQTYVELLSGNARFDKQSSLKTFVFSVVQNLARSRYRKLATRLRLIRTYEQDAAGDQVTGEATTDDSGVWRTVKALPARQRDIIELVFCRDLTVEEASAVMGVSVGTGRQHYARAKNALRDRLQEFVEE